MALGNVDKQVNRSLSCPASSGASSNHRNIEFGGYWIARSSRAMTLNLKHLFVDASLKQRFRQGRLLRALITRFAPLLIAWRAPLRLG